MKTWIRIDGEDIDASALALPPDRLFREAWKLSGQAVSIDLDRARAIQLERIRAEGERRLGLLTADYGPHERDTWATQTREAEALAGDPSAPTPFLSALAARRGIDIADMAAIVIERRDLFTQQAAAILGAQQALEAAATMAETLEALKAIDPHDAENW